MSNDSSPDSDTDTDETSAELSGRSPTWVDMMGDVFDTAIDRQAEIECEVEDMEIEIPLQLGPDADYARWKVNGTLRFSFDGVRGPLAEWFRLQETREGQQQPNKRSPDQTRD